MEKQPPEQGIQVQKEQERKKEINVEGKTLILLLGVPASGKSTFAAEHFPLDAIVSTDRLRQDLTNNPSNQMVSKKAFELAERITHERLAHGKIAVIDAMNLTDESRERFLKTAEKMQATIQVIVFELSEQENFTRNERRKRSVEKHVMKQLRTVFETAKRTVSHDTRISQIHVLKPYEAEKVVVSLPKDDQEALKLDIELMKQAAVAESILAVSETGFLRRESKPEKPRIELEAGSVLCVFGTEPSETEAFLSQNFLPHQMIDARSIAKRLGTDITDEAVKNVMQMILDERTRLNLTTVMTAPKGFPFESELTTTAPKQFISPREAHSNVQMDIVRDAPEDAPLLIIGDVQGCYQAMRELARQVREENLAKINGKIPGPKRTIVFVGDMADRGPFDAESVIYITSLVRSGRAILVKGNHDENLLQGLKNQEVKSEETRSTVAELKKRLKPASINRIISMLEAAPAYAEWKHLVVTHAALPRIPRRDETPSSEEEHVMTHGARSGRFVGGRSEVWKLHATAAHDPDVLVVGGHTHEKKMEIDLVSGTAILDVEAEVRGELWGLYYPELDLVSAKEPRVLELYAMLKSESLPEGDSLLAFVEYARQQGFLEVKRGVHEYDGLILATYSQVTEMSNAWEDYPVLRHFRGLIFDTQGNIVARPFEKTHKAGIEIPLEQLQILPEKIFEKANGSLGIVYFWKNKWRAATKFSFENKEYTQETMEMLSHMNMSILNPEQTYLFEIILPNDAHLVDYSGKRELVLLNIMDKTGVSSDWKTVEQTATELGARTAVDMTAQFPGMTIAQIYEQAQQPGGFSNLEGMMAVYQEKNGKKKMVKVKTREYDEKKFVRDYLHWDRIFEAINPKSVSLSEEAKERLLKYNNDNLFARVAIETRMNWIHDRYHEIVANVRNFLLGPLTDGERIVQSLIDQGVPKDKAASQALRQIIPQLITLLKINSQGFVKEDINTLTGFLRQLLSEKTDPSFVLAEYALKQIKKMIETETARRGKNAFWIIPN